MGSVIEVHSLRVMIFHGAKDRITDLFLGVIILVDEIEGIVNGDAFGDHVRHEFDHDETRGKIRNAVLDAVKDR